MKKIGVLFIALMGFVFPGHSQNNGIGADDDFMKLLIQMGPELRAPKSVGSYEMLQNLSSKIDDDLAYKYLWQKNQYVKQEESECYPIGFVLNKENDIAILFFFKGPASNLAFFVDVQTYNYKKGKLIDQLIAVAGFAKDNSACNLFVTNPNLMQLRTVTAFDDTKIDLKINNKGKIDRN